MSKNVLCQLRYFLIVAIVATGGVIFAQNLDSDNTSYIVKKGETVYGISKKYNIPLETIYRMNPNAKQGVKKGDVLIMPKVDTKEDEVINSKLTQNIKEEKKIVNVEKKDSHKEGASNSTKVKEDKPKIKEEKRIKETKKKEKESNINSENINSFEEEAILLIEEEDQEILFENETDSIFSENDDFLIKIVLLLDDPNSKKDIDFTRGFLTRLQGFTSLDYKINLKVMDGGVSTVDIINELDNYEPEIIITTADKTFPLFLADYGNTNDIEIVNVFDLKNDLYEDNPSVIQILTPSSLFNRKIAEKIYKDNKSRKVLLIGEIDENDGIAVELMELFGTEAQPVSLEEFGGFEPDYLQPLLLYSYASKKEEVADLMNNVDNLLENYPGIDFRMVGRASWIAMLDEFEDKFKEYSVNIPSRVWIDEEGKNWKEFYEEFEKLFGGLPIRSIPNFAVSGYDMANFIVPLMSQTKGDLDYMEINGPREIGLQNDIKLKKMEDGGYVNEVGYIIVFRPSGQYEKIIVD